MRKTLLSLSASAPAQPAEVGPTGVWRRHHIVYQLKAKELMSSQSFNKGYPQGMYIPKDLSPSASSPGSPSHSSGESQLKARSRKSPHMRPGGPYQYRISRVWVGHKELIKEPWKLQPKEWSYGILNMEIRKELPTITDSFLINHRLIYTWCFSSLKVSW